MFRGVEETVKNTENVPSQQVQAHFATRDVLATV
jgi:hypothetical protein